MKLIILVIIFIIMSVTVYGQKDGEKVPKLKSAFLFSNGGVAHVHSTLEQGEDIIRDFATGNNPDNHTFGLYVTPSVSNITSARLAQHDVLILNNTTTLGEVFAADKKKVFEDYVNAGGGVHGWHGATDTWFRNNYPWFVDWISSVYVGSSDWNATRMNRTADADDPEVKYITEHWNDEFNMISEEWYQYDPNPSDNPNNKILITVNPNDVNADKVSYMPYAWVNDSKAGRVFMTGFGHKAEILDRGDVQKLLYFGLIYAAGGYDIAGCMDANATNYRPEATIQGDVVCENISAVQDIKSEGFFKVNKSRGEVNFKIIDNLPYKIKFFDIKGGLEWFFEGNKAKDFNIKNLNQGIYFVKVEILENNKIHKKIHRISLL